jgi:tRNA(Ile)-lysidine synthase
VVLLRQLAAALDGPSAPARGEHVLVAVSGGPDSTALLAGLAELAAARSLRLSAGAVDHGLRGAEGTGECERVGALAARLGAGFLTRVAAVGPGAGLEARARRLRYRALVAMAGEVGATCIATGHTLDDQVETLLLRLLRGAGRRGLAAMAVRRGALWRPLLAVTRADAYRFLAARGIAYALDRSNADLGHVRNRVRRLLVPFLEAEFNPRLRPALAALAARLRDEEAYLAAAAASRAGAFVDGDRLRRGVTGEPPALGRRIVRAWLGERATASHVERVLALAAGRAGGTVAVPGPARVLRDGDDLVRRPGRQAAERRVCLPIAAGEVVRDPYGRWRLRLSAPRPRGAGEERAADAAHALLDADALHGPLVVRSPAAGDRLRVPRVGTRKLQDVLTDAKVPREDRAGVPVLAAGGEILWVAGVARGSGARIGPATQRVIEGFYERPA